MCRVPGRRIRVLRIDEPAGAFVISRSFPSVSLIWSSDLPADLATDLEQATLAVARLNGPVRELMTLEGVARQLLRSESLASSRIEGLELGHRRIAARRGCEELCARCQRLTPRTSSATSDAMQQAIEIAAGPGNEIDPGTRC